MPFTPREQKRRDGDKRQQRACDRRKAQTGERQTIGSLRGTHG
jgi:hypothetical protein